MEAKRRTSIAGKALLLAATLTLALGIVPRSALAAATTVSTEEELRAAVSPGAPAGEVKLDANLVLAKSLLIGADEVTLDLAGHSLSGSKALPGAAETLVVIPVDKKVTIRDSSGSNAGCLTNAERAIANSGTLTITTGRICKNSGPCDGNGIYNDSNGSLTIAGGVIEENVSEDGHDGAGIFNRGKLNISNCLIQKNSTDTKLKSGGYGGAIYNGTGGNFTLSGGTVSENYAERGGGIYLKSDSDVMVLMGRTRVQKNVATAYGGAIYNESGSKSSRLSFMAGTISENEAGVNGGGIYNDGTIAASGGSVTKNHAASMGGAGVYQNGTFLISGSLVVQGNTDADGVDNDVYIKEKHTLTLEAALTSRAKIGVFCDDSHQIMTTDFSKFNEGADPSTFFFGNPNDKQKDIRFFIVDEGDVYGEVQCVIVIHYKDEDGDERECIWYRDATTDHWGDWDQKDPAWFVVRKDKKIDDYIGVRGDVNLILVAGKTLKTECIELNRTDDKVRAELTIYNSFDDEYGKLIADASDSRSAGIGFRHGNSRVGSVTIVGGWIEAYGGDEGAGIGGVENHGNGPIRILGGHVKAVGGKWAAGIGGGQGGDQDNPIRIENAYVEAYGGKHGAGIGGGDSDRGGADGGRVYIKNSTVKAYGKDLGAGIGGGEDGDGGDVTITNSDVYAEGGYKGAGIGGGQDGDDGGTLTVRSGTVNAYGGKEAAAIGGGQNCCGGQFIAEGGTIFALAGDGCSTAIGAGHKDYHEGSKQVYNSAMVTVSHYHDGKDAYTVNADYRVKGCSWHYVKIEPCTHPGARAYTDLGPEEHRLAQCLYCTAEGPRDEAHVFDSNTHVCPCGHREIAITLKDGDGAEDASKTSYVSEGLKYRLPYKISLEKYFTGWQVTGTKKTDYPGTLPAGTEIEVELAEGAEGIVATAQWAPRHKHGLVEHPATEPTCTTDGNILFWECEEPNEDSQPCGGLFVKDEEGFLVPVSNEDTIIPALGHDWGEATYTWSEDNGSCEARHACARCNFVGTEKARVISWTEDPSCTKAKTSTHVALFSDESFETQRKTVVEGEPLGHLWGEPTYEWSDDHLTCTARRVCARDKGDEEMEVANATWVSSGATCSQDGTVTYTATFDNEAFETQVVEVKGIDPSAHAWGEPTFAWSDTPEGKLCTARRVCQNDPAHVEEEAILAQESVIKAETCTTAGEKVYTVTFANNAFGTQKTSVQIAATGHDWGDWVTEGTLKSRVCKRDSSHVQTTTIPPEGHVHQLQHVDASEATCTKPGNLEHWICSGDGGCGHFFEDEAATKELYSDQVYLPELGHAWGEPTYTWSEDGAYAIAVRRCTRMPLHFQLGVAQASEDVLRDPTCTDWGETVYTATFDNPVFAPQSREAETAPLGHEFVDWETTTAPTCTTAGEETSHCTHDPSHVKTRAIEPLGHEWGEWQVTTPATETAEGTEVRACTRCSTLQTRAIPPTSHAHGLSLTEAIAATCDTPGRVAYWVCDKGEHPCGRYFADPLGLRELSNSETVVPALGHNWGAPTYEWSEDDATCTARRVCLNDASHVEEETVAVSSEVKSTPNCTKGGTTVHRAAFVNAAFEAQTKTEYLPALGHTPEMQPRHTNVVAPTCETGGGYDAETYCSVCNVRIGEPVHVAQGPLGHDWGEWKQTKAPTCTEKGLEERVCERDKGHKETRAVAPVGHEWGDWAQTTPPTETEQGVETRTCLHDSSHTETRTIAPTGHVHKPVHVDANPATCTGAGCIEHWACEGRQTCTFVNFGAGDPTLTLADGKQLWQVDPLSVVLDPLGHDWGEWNQTKAPTCTEEGVEERVCKRDGCDATKVENVDALGHRPFETVVTNLLDPTCVAPGFSWSKIGCDRCHQTLQFLLRTTPALGHDWGEWSVTVPATKTSEGEMARFCKRDASHKEAIAIPQITPDHEHAWEEPTYTWSDDLSEVTATRVCRDDAEHVETEVARAVVEPGSGGRVQVVPEVITFPTCTEAGETCYTAWFVNPAFDVQERKVETPAYGHDWSDWEVVREATPEDDGLERRTCSRCGITEERAIAWPDVGSTPTYRCESDEVVWTRGDDAGATFTFKRSESDETTFSHFVGVTLDGEVVDDERYDATSGSAVVTFHTDYLEELELGGHEVKALFDDGEPAAVRLVVREDDASEPARRAWGASPKTGDAPWGAAVALLGVFAVATGVLGARLRRMT